MQTFLPYPDFAASARVLDRQRLGKQRVECLQILRALGYCVFPGEAMPQPIRDERGCPSIPSSSWRNHPCTRMWADYPLHLVQYQRAIIMEWVSRGYNNTMTIAGLGVIPLHEMPPWLTSELCASHRSNLLRKAPDHYRRFWPDEPDDLPYVWPV